MGVLTAEMRRMIERQRLGFAATACPDGTPNLSPKGTLAVWDADHLVFADICSPGTVANLRSNPAIELNVVDPFARRGFRFNGTGSVIEAGAAFEAALAFFRARGSTVLFEMTQDAFNGDACAGHDRFSSHDPRIIDDAMWVTVGLHR